MEEKETYTLELLRELKMQSKRWFIAFIVVLCVFMVTSVVSTVARMKMDYRIDMIEQDLTEHRSASGAYFKTFSDYINEKSGGE